MSALNSFIESELKHRVNDYSTSPNYILEHYGAEIQNIEAYNGRQLLEMLQNADDASFAAKEKKAALVLENGKLRISNNGEPFDQEGFTSLMYIHRSFKPMQKDMIGQKGLGFRSILSWAKSVVIQSGENKISFSQARAESFLKKLIKDFPPIFDFLTQQSDVKYPIAILRIPEILEWTKTSYDYDTSVIIELKDHAKDEVVDQMENMISMETMLFLKNLDEIEIKSDSQHTLYRRTIEGDLIQVDKLDMITGEKITKTWYVNKVTGTHKKKDYELAIAWNDQLDDEINLLYSFFETQVKFPFPAILHGTFELTPDRNSIVNDTSGHNKFLIDVLADLLVDTAIIITNKNKKASYAAIMLLNIDFDAIDPRIQNLGFEDLLVAKIKTKAIFPNVNGTYITHSEKPVFYESPIADLISGEDVTNLLISTNNESVKHLLTKLGGFYYQFAKICEIISIRLQTLNTAKAAQLIQFLFNYPKYAEEFKSKTFLIGNYPALLIDDKGGHISWKDQIFLHNDQDSDFDLPASINVSFVNQLLYIELLNLYGSDSSSLLLSHLRWLDVKVYSFKDIAATIVAHYANADSVERVIECHKYLFQLYELEAKKGLPDPLESRSRVNAFSQKNKITTVNKLYFGKEHGNDLAQYLYSYDKNKILSSFNSFNLQGEQLLIIAYFKWLGVELLPRLYKKIISPKSLNYMGYKEYILRGFDYRNNRLEPYNEIYKDFNELFSEIISVNEIRVAEYDELETILLKARPEHIFRWINASENLRLTLESNQELYDSSITTLSLRSKVNERSFSAKKMRSYTRWVMANTPWLPVDSVVLKASPDKCCISRTITKDYSPYVEKPKIDLLKIAERIKLSEEILENYLLLIGVHKEISSFSMSTLYEMLASLEKTDSKRTVGSTIYREIASNYDDAKLDFSHPFYLKFIEEGKVLCNKGIETDYFKVNESYYINTKNFGSNVLRRFPLITVDKKRGAQKVKKLFGVQPLQNITFNILGQPDFHSLNPYFEEEISRFKALIYALRINADNNGDIKSRLKKTKIHLVEKISVDYTHAGNKEAFTLEQFEFVNKKENYYLLIPEAINQPDELRYSIAMGDAVAEIFTAVITTEEYRSFIRELYSTREINREELLLKEIQLDNNDIIMKAKLDLNIIDDIRLSFWRAFAVGSGQHTKSDIKDELKLRQFLTNKLKLSDSLVMALINIETYSGLSDLVNQEVFYEMFQKFKIDFSTFTRHFTGLDFTLLFKNIFEDIKARYKSMFMEALYQEYIVAEDIEKKRKYFNVVKKYDNGAYDPLDKYQTDMMKYFKSQIKRLYKIDLKEQGVLFSCNDKINENINLLSIENIVFPELLLESEEFQAMVLFYEIDEVKALIQNYKQKEAKEATPINGEKHIKVKGKLVIFTDYKSLAEQLMETTNFSKFKIQMMNTLKDDLLGKGKKRSGNSSGKKAVRFNTGNEELIGFITEFLAVNQLFRKYGKEKVEWISENAFRAINSYTSEAGKGYDIEITDNGKVRYIEVKGIANIKDGIRITSTEMAKALEFPDKYDLMIVENPLGEIPIFRYIKAPFRFKKEESLLSNKHLNIINDNYIIKFKWDE
jgi:hypothetical protein